MKMNIDRRGLVRVVMIALALVFGFSAGGCDDKKGIRQIEPNFGNVAGNDDVSIIGKGFKPGIEVRIGGRKANNIVIESDTKIRIKTPSGAEGTADVSVTDENGKTVLLKKAFTYRKASKK